MARTKQETAREQMGETAFRSLCKLYQVERGFPRGEGHGIPTLSTGSQCSAENARTLVGLRCLRLVSYINKGSGRQLMVKMTDLGRRVVRNG